jgi:uncharacterized protein YndB with AHSA1/START domain
MTTMWGGVTRELEIERPPEEVWRALTDNEELAKWMYPNDFADTEGQEFTLTPPPNPRADFDGRVHGRVLVARAPEVLAYTWSGGPVVGTVVRYRLRASESGGTLISFEHSGFDLASPFGADALAGADIGWRVMLSKLEAMLAQ